SAVDFFLSHSSFNRSPHHVRQLKKYLKLIFTIKDSIFDMADNEFLPVYMHLQLNTSSPDPIGFGNVSGFYGPGAWAAWFLTLCASWINILGYKRGFDSSTFMYLIAINGSAIDILLHLRAMVTLKQASDPAWMKEAASVGAAFMLTWWGLCGAITQAIALL
ncbi:hypothetical protein BKA61DRAFT_691251, partial [Leptodontidium sp. MPI-SDFR-AT-0119]